MSTYHQIFSLDDAEGLFEAMAGLEEYHREHPEEPLALNNHEHTYRLVLWPDGDITLHPFAGMWDNLFSLTGPEVARWSGRDRPLAALWERFFELFHNPDHPLLQKLREEAGS